ncbi:putative DNA-3-methyladenine glycosylase II [Thiomonas arsenitoxydans]|uniref:DNA-3-methyladenine glycosylase II n=2 Tax=Thiomonas arsenitoxydans (strain DSM 22701 / CIP 110005 / 3As) TaxID=426114 RepID=D6CRF2_THIA3|nr:putative DNA-3-methyladenine glycosylase II [Thiomonas arsenitoxydans]CQR41098.1 putative DNA-3-methyladenine glycosylase II [Thiomonas arsenitoxydans]CQR41197.1 putative DNA-3-methyladenine glycosylase II [Thiomonas arsenitoxydans]
MMARAPAWSDTVVSTKGPIPLDWDKACAHLQRTDRVMRKLIKTHAGTRLQSRGDPFQTLARSIIGQQISVKAAQTVWDRLCAAVPQVAPEHLVGLDDEALRACGLSGRKAGYVRDLAVKFHAGEVHPDQWQEMPDEAIAAELLTIRGIGRWTADMFLIFHLMRPDVLPLGDLGLIKGVSQTYFAGEPVTQSEVREVAAAWAPWRSVGTWYIWRSLDPLPVAY